MMGDEVPDQNHVLRYLGQEKIDHDANGLPVPLGSGFIPREADQGKLSCNWLEYFNDALEGRIRLIRSHARIEYGRNAKLAMLNIGRVRTHVMRNTDDRRDLVVIHDPLDETSDKPADPSHALITNMPGPTDPMSELVGDLIAECVTELFPARQPP